MGKYIIKLMGGGELLCSDWEYKSPKMTLGIDDCYDHNVEDATICSLDQGLISGPSESLSWLKIYPTFTSAHFSYELSRSRRRV